MTKILETERLYLRELNQNDYNDLSEILQDELVMYAYEHAFSDSEVGAWLDNQLRRYKEDGFGLWAVIEKDTGKFVGQTGLTIQDANGSQVVEIGYLFKKKYWHKGFATEAAIGCKNYAFYSLDKEDVYSIIRDSNTPSRNVAKRNGMTEVGSFVKHYYNMDMPHIIYRVSRH